MLVQIQFLPRGVGGGRFIPPPDIFSPLASLGRSIATIIDPQAETKRELALLFLANPALGAQFAAAQRRAERERVEAIRAEPPPELTPEELQAAATAREEAPPAVAREAARLEVPPPANIFPFLPAEFTRGALAPFPETLEERVGEVIRRDQDIVRMMADAVILQVENQIETLEADTATKRVIASVMPQLEPMISAVARTPGERLALLAALREENMAQTILGFMQLDTQEAIEQLRAVSEMAALGDPMSKVELVERRFGLIAKFNEEMGNLITQIAEADRHTRPLFISNLRNALAFRDEQFKEAGISLQSAVELNTRLSLFLKRLEGVEFKEIEFPDLNLEGKNIDPVTATQVANAALNKIEDGTIKEVSESAVRDFVLDSPSGLEVIATMSGDDQRRFYKAVVDRANERADAAEKATAQIRRVQMGRQELEASLRENRAALARVRLIAETRVGLHRRQPGGRKLSAQEEGTLRAAANLALNRVIDPQTGKTGKELRELIKADEDQLKVFISPVTERPRR